MARTLIALCFVSILALVVAAPTAQCGETESKQAADPQTTDEPKPDPKLSPFVQATGGPDRSSSKVFTNKDLKKLQGMGSSSASTSSSSPTPVPTPTRDKPPAVEAAASQPKTALEQMFEQEALRKEHEQKIVEAEQRVVTARQSVVDLEKRLLAIKNPFLARPKTPEDGAREWESGNSQQRVDMTEARVQAAREEIAQAERDLAALRNSRP